MSRPLLQRRHYSYILACIIASVLVIACAFIVVKHFETKNVSNLTPAQFQAADDKLVNLMRMKSITAAFSYAEDEIQTNPSFAKDCHPLLHELGHAAYTYYGGYQQAIRYQNEICDSGYTHGVLESYLSAVPDISQALQTACNPTASTFVQWQCYHGLGHGVMLVHGNNIGQSISLCDTLTASSANNACINGVYMQHFVVTSHDGVVPTTNPTSLHDCTSQPVQYKSTCYTYAPSAYLTVYSGQYTAALSWCSGAEVSYHASCVDGVGNQAMKENITNPSLAEHVCRSAGSYTQSCVRGAIEMYIFFHASSTSAQPLCQNQYSAYKTTCEQTILAEHTNFGI